MKLENAFQVATRRTPLRRLCAIGENAENPYKTLVKSMIPEVLQELIGMH